MPDEPRRNPPPDQSERERALDVNHSVLVRAPAGSGKTDLLTRRFLRLLGVVESPGQIVAITFTKAAAAEMRQRILSELEKAASDGSDEPDSDPFSMQSLAHNALGRSLALGWNLIDLPAQLRISTIDAFCREVALQKPLLSGLGSGLDISEQPTELYLRAARRTLEQIDAGDPPLREAIRTLLLWRDNSWKDLEDQLVSMLAKRDQWMHEFVLGHAPDWEALRKKLERPLAREVNNRLLTLSTLLDQAPSAREEALELARFACGNGGDNAPHDLAECVAIPTTPFADGIDSARDAFAALATFLLTQKGAWRSEKGLKTSDGFPSTPPGKKGKEHFASLITRLSAVPGIRSALASMNDLPPAQYTEEDWKIVRSCFVLLRHAAGELRVVFGEAAETDYIEVAQIAQNALRGDDDLPAEGVLAVADGIRHLLVDEFQDTSRRQHRLLAQLMAAWPEREKRTCFVVGDPMQSIYFFRDADASLFTRTECRGLEIPGDQPLRFEPVQLRANFRTAPNLVRSINKTFEAVFATDDGSGVTFTEASPARDEAVQSGSRIADPTARMQLHLEFIPARSRGNNRKTAVDLSAAQRVAAKQKQTDEIVELIRSYQPRIDQARAEVSKFRVAILGRTRNALIPIADALHKASIPFRAVELEGLSQRPEIIDALSLIRALMNPQDRVAWLGALRAPWCGLSLTDLFTLTADGDKDLLARAIPDLITERAGVLSEEGRLAVERLRNAFEFSGRLRAARPTAAPGTWIEQVWLRLGGAQCVNATARANLDLLWKSLDCLPHGEQDLLGPALQSALRDLKALPDPDTDSNFGVQLMTIHAAKGLEFEVVIVPELQARAQGGERSMLSWLERGLPPDVDPENAHDSEEITEFLVAPFPSKGTDRGMAKKWVDDMRRSREQQETRRVLYVAATRAREELHLFARPEYKTEKGGEMTLAKSGDTLLKTAWPAIEAKIEECFAAWQTAQARSDQDREAVAAIAAAEEEKILQWPAPSNPALLRRLPPEFAPELTECTHSSTCEPQAGDGHLYERHKGGLISRTLGVAVHLLLQHMAQLLAVKPPEAATASLAEMQPAIASTIRAAGIESSHADSLAAKALEITLEAASDSSGQWILAPHDEAANEVRWTGIVSGELRTVQLDRIFRAGSTPHAEDNGTWWIIDYKTAYMSGIDPTQTLLELHRLFAPQIEAYAKILRNLRGAQAEVYGGLYYPRMKQFDWWKL